MDPVINPFSPGAGAPPPELVGRDEILEEAKILLGRVRLRKPVQGCMLTGLRGVGKTVLLSEVKRMAYAQSVIPIAVEATEEKPIGALLAAPLKKYYLSWIAWKVQRTKLRGELLRSRISLVLFVLTLATLGLE